MEMKIGDTVKYSKPAQGEESFRFILLSDPEQTNALSIQWFNNDYRFKPIEIVAKEEVVCA